jgi:hypothetical protein
MSAPSATCACGHEERDHDRIDWACNVTMGDDCPCERFSPEGAAVGVRDLTKHITRADKAEAEVERLQYRGPDCIAALKARVAELTRALREIAVGKIEDDQNNAWICAARLSAIARAALDTPGGERKETR